MSHEIPRPHLTELGTRAENVRDIILSHIPENGTNIIAAEHRAQLLGFALGVKPAFYSTNIIEKPDELIKKLAAQKINAYIHQGTLLINRPATELRIKNHAKLAKSLGWKEGMSLEKFLEGFDPLDKSKRGKGIAGLVLGFPESAITAYIQNTHDQGFVVIKGPNGANMFCFHPAKEGAAAADVMELRERVHEALQSAGYFYTSGK